MIVSAWNQIARESIECLPDQIDALARTIHANYSEATQPAQRQSWESLTLELQDSNRAAADHIGVVMRQLLASGCHPRRPDLRWEPANSSSGIVVSTVATRSSARRCRSVTGRTSG